MNNSSLEIAHTLVIVFVIGPHLHEPVHGDRQMVPCSAMAEGSRGSALLVAMILQLQLYLLMKILLMMMIVLVILRLGGVDRVVVRQETVREDALPFGRLSSMLLFFVLGDADAKVGGGGR